MDNSTKIKRDILSQPKILGADDIHYLLYLSESSASEIAKEKGVSRSTVSQVISSRRSSIDIAAHIACTIGTTTNRIWPDKYFYKPRRPASQALAAN